MKKLISAKPVWNLTSTEGYKKMRPETQLNKLIKMRPLKPSIREILIVTVNGIHSIFRQGKYNEYYNGSVKLNAFLERCAAIGNSKVEIR